MLCFIFIQDSTNGMLDEAVATEDALFFPHKNRGVNIAHLHNIISILS